MYASNAKIRILGLGGKSGNRRPYIRRLGVREFIRMPCLLPASIVVALGLLAVLAGAGMSVIGYVPSHTFHNSTKHSHINTTLNSPDQNGPKYPTLKVYAYIGPILMALGIFAMITACVFYCEVLDKYAILVPDKRTEAYSKEELYEIIVGEMKKSYAQTLITIYTKAAEHSLLADNSSVEYVSEPTIFPYKTKEPLTLEQQIDIECEGYTPSPPIPNKRYSIIQARIQRLKSEDNWLKTSSLPNIRRIASIKQACRVAPKVTDSRTLSCDYTMDEARLRRKSMMLRTIVQWNSGSSDLFAERQRRFSSAKALPSYKEGSMDDISQKEFGSFPLTRLIQRRGTFACGDMRTRRMKFLLLLEASESQEGFNDAVSVDGRQTVAGIRRNSFIPYTTCDKFIAGEERKTIRDRRRSSVNPFSLRSRVGPTAPQAGTRRHSFYPIRRDTRIYNEPLELRRHSFNPVGVSNTLKSDFVAKADIRRTSLNPESLSYRPEERRLSHVPHPSARFLQVPGCDPSMEARPNPATIDSHDTPPHSGSDPIFPFRAPGGAQNFQDDRIIDRRHSFSPVVRLSAGGGDGGQLTLPKISINEESPERFLSVPSQEYYIEERERRHSVNVTPSRAALSTAVSSKLNEKPNPQRISFKLEPSAPSTHLSPSSTQTAQKSTLKPSKPSTFRERPTSFKQEMIVFRPLKQSESRSGSPCSNTSCCGSEKVESVHSGAVSRATSICSDRSAKTTFNVSPVPAVAAVIDEFGPFQQATSFQKTIREENILLEDMNQNIPQTLQFLPSKMKTDIPLSTAGFCKDSGIERKSAFRHTGGRVRTLDQNVDTPGSTNSGPAALSASCTTDSSVSMHRSKSASTLVWAETARPASPHATFSYARVPKPTSPLVTRHKTPQYPTKKYS